MGAMSQEEINNDLFDEVNRQKREIKELKDQNKQYEETLAFYADEKTYKLGVRISMGTAHPQDKPIKYDLGEKARKTLLANKK